MEFLPSMDLVMPAMDLLLLVRQIKIQLPDLVRG
jgi:hypothetical protein